jgi:uncharacterized delta-60 repeat protein
VVRLACVSLVIATSLVTASGAGAATERPGTLELRFGFSASARIEGLDVGPGGRIVVAGRYFGYPGNHLWVRAYRSDGSADSSFSGDGAADLADDNRNIAGTLVQPDGRVVVAYNSGFSYPRVARLAADGTPDPTFGNGGTTELPFGHELTDIALQPDGRLIVAGVANSSVANDDIFVGRYLPDGSPDPGFGSNGFTILPAGTSGARPAVAVQPGGGLVITLERSDGAAIVRLGGDGRLDTSFGAGGLAQVELGRPRLRARLLRRSTGPGPRAVILPGGRIRVPVTLDMPREKSHRIALVGLTQNGHPDRAFGSLGLALGPRAEPRGDSPETAVADQHRGIIVAGIHYGEDEFSFADGALTLRFRADGTFDRSFGRGGLVAGALPASGYAVFGQKLAFLDADTVVAAVHTFDGKYGFWGPAVLRMLQAGYDRDDPLISLVAGCRPLRVRISDLSALDRVIVRADGRVIRRTSRKRLRVRLPKGTRRLSVRATDLAGNSSIRKARLPQC